MKNWITISIAAGLLAISSSALLADTATNSLPNSGQNTTKSPDAAKKAAERRQLLAILGISRADLKGLTPEDRKAKIKEAADKKMAELEQKQTAGSLTAKEQSDLDLLKKFEHHAHAKKSDS
jgi:hypothetical protein